MSYSRPATVNKDNNVNHKEPCNAFGCNRTSSVKIDIDCGRFGNLTIYVCNGCKSKFKSMKKTDDAKILKGENYARRSE
jgi:hypothetical protein